MSSEDNKRIAKNTLFLYVRMFLTIVVNLYAVRVIWQVLGVVDYGTYNVVGGIVAMFAFLNNAMVASSQRFISFELGRGNNERLRKVFCISVTVHLMLAAAILILAETVGLWFLNEKLNIPSGRMTAANWVYQCSVIAFMINVISVPYNACIVAHEHMKAYGYFGVAEVVLKLSIVFALILIPYDKLITYSILVVCVSGIMRFCYGYYCRKNFAECRYRYVTDHHLMRDMFSFAGWSFIGNLGFSVRDQGLNIVINLFFNVAVNAAKGIANQIGVVVSGFASNFTMAINPQITKRYASGNMDGMKKLIYSGCKFSLLLLSLIALPLIVSAERVLQIWLGEVTPYTSGFLRLTLVLSLIESVVHPLTTALQATGHIRTFQIAISILMMSNIPISWLLLIETNNPMIVMYSCMFTSIIGVGVRLNLLKKLVQISSLKFFKEVFLRSTLGILISLLVSFKISTIMSTNIPGLILFCLVSSVISLTFYYLFSLTTSERQTANHYISKVFTRLAE